MKRLIKKANDTKDIYSIMKHNKYWYKDALEELIPIKYIYEDVREQTLDLQEAESAINRCGYRFDRAKRLSLSNCYDEKNINDPNETYEYQLILGDTLEQIHQRISDVCDLGEAACDEYSKELFGKCGDEFNTWRVTNVPLDKEYVFSNLKSEIIQKYTAQIVGYANEAINLIQSIGNITETNYWDEIIQERNERKYR